MDCKRIIQSKARRKLCDYRVTSRSDERVVNATARAIYAAGADDGDLDGYAAGAGKQVDDFLPSGRSRQP
ncbi:MAG: hypothetical protein ACLVJO_10245 [[Clostridium] scindens]